MTSAKELNSRGQNTDLILETGFVEDASAFSYVFCNLRAIRSERECDDNAKLAHTDGSWPVPIGMRQKSGNVSKMVCFERVLLWCATCLRRRRALWWVQRTCLRGGVNG